MIGKPFEIHAPQVAFANVVSFWGIGGFLKKESQLTVELIRKLSAGDIFVVIHDPRDVGSNLPMKLQTHQLRRPWIWESNCAREIA
jgi:hypothetical protein